MVKLREVLHRVKNRDKWPGWMRKGRVNPLNRRSRIERRKGEEHTYSVVSERGGAKNFVYEPGGPKGFFSKEIKTGLDKRSGKDRREK